MIGTVDVSVVAKYPSMPLDPMQAYVGSPSSIRIRNVPKRIGDWCIKSVQFVAVYPDASTKTAQCVLVGGIWVGTIEGTTTSGTSKNGYSIYASGTDENGNNVSGYCLGKGDIEILKGDGTIDPTVPTYYVHLLDAQSQTPHDGDMWNVNGTYYIWQNGQARLIGLTSIPDAYKTYAETVASLSNDGYALQSDVALNPIYGGTPVYSDWTYTPDDGTYLEWVNDGWYLNGIVGPEPISRDPDALTLTYGSFSGETITATRTATYPAIVGWRMGQDVSGNPNRDKLIQPKGDYALSTNVTQALALKQDNLTSAQISAIDSVVDERQTIVDYGGGITQALNIVGTLSRSQIPDVANIHGIKIGNTVTAIANNTFYDCTYLTSVTIPNSVTSIGEDAFRSCTSLTSVTIPDSVTSIGGGAFASCALLASVTFGKGITSIEPYTFNDCPALGRGGDTIVIPEGVTAIKQEAFGYCPSIASIVIPKSVTRMDMLIFDNPFSLASVTFIGKTLQEVQNIEGIDGYKYYPWGISNPSIINTWNDASQEWVNAQGYVTTSDLPYAISTVSNGILLDRAMNKISTSSNTSLTLPVAQSGKVRDFLLRAELSGSTVPTLTFNAPSGETIVYETDDDAFPSPDEVGTWLYSFTETDAHKFAVGLKKLNVVTQGA